MILHAEMHAFAGGAIREIEIPDDEWKSQPTFLDRLELAFYYGQNEHQPRPGLPSLSIGDVLVVPHERYLLSYKGWQRR